MNTFVTQIVLPLMLSILTAFVVASLSGFGLTPHLNIVVSTAVILLLLSPILYLELIGAIFQSAGSWKIAGRWRSTWRYVKNGEVIAVCDDITLRQWGSFVRGFGKSSWTNEHAPFREFNYRFQGVVNAEGLIEGKWQNRDGGRIYYGVFQLKISRSCNEIEGLWIGNSKSELRSGEWHWERSEHSNG
jgi:hypothetical protein